jgi:hypothetical protein
MDPDLRDLLVAFTGGGVPDGRRQALLARLAADAAFRAAAARELGTLGRIRAAQSPEPRWLELEEAMGAASGHDDFATRVLAEAERDLRRRALPRRLGLAAAAAALVGLAAGALLVRGPDPSARPDTPAPVTLAVAVQADGVDWEPGGAARPAPGDPVVAGPLRFRAGRLVLALLNGVTLTLEGPADVDLVSTDRVECRRGRLRALAPKGAEGFTVMTPGCAVVDLGTEFGVEVAPGGPSRVRVFDGQAEVSVLAADGTTLRSARVGRDAAVEVDPSAGRIRAADATAGAMPRGPDAKAPALALDDGYAAAVRAARPWGYWRFDAEADGRYPSDAAGGPALRRVGPVRRSADAAAPHALVFEPSEADAYLVLDGLWAPSRERGYAVECWVLSAAFHRATLVSLSPPPEGGPEGHGLLLELTARSRDVFHAPGAIRFLHRWPPGASGGTNVFSRGMVAPNRWAHVVAQRRPDRMELYVDGSPAGTSPVDATDDIAPSRVFVGRLLQHPKPELGQMRPFYGRLDELALYDHPLTEEEIRRHAGMRKR